MNKALDKEDTLWYTDSYQYPPKTESTLVIYKCNKDTEINFMSDKINDYSKRIDYNLWADVYSPPPVYEKGYPSYKAVNGYEPESVEKEIKKDTSISKKSAKLIHSLLKGHS